MVALCQVSLKEGTYNIVLSDCPILSLCITNHIFKNCQNIYYSDIKKLSEANRTHKDRRRLGRDSSIISEQLKCQSV